jgi:hypothetical protein
MVLRSEYDVIVVGAGIAGIAAAVKAARSGASVLLVEQYGFVGGMSTAGMVSPFMKHEVNGEILVRGVFEELETEMRMQHGMIDNGFYANAFRSASYLLLKAAGVTLLLHSVISGAKNTGASVESITVWAAGSEHTIHAHIFIDTSGDAQLLYLAGLPWVKGDEKTGLLQALTLFFRMGNIDIDAVATYARQHKDDFFEWMDYAFEPGKILSVAGYFTAVRRAIAERRLSPEVQYIFFTTLPESGEGSFNTSNILSLDGSSSLDLTKAELVGRTQVHQVVELLKREIPGFEHAYLIETAPQVGIRETRRAIGDYSVTGADITEGRKFHDAVARGCYGIDIHGQKNEQSVMEHLPAGAYYEIPLRALIVQESDNVLAAGRCISSTREGHSALRIQPTAAATGEACGALAALASASRTPLRQIDYQSVQQLVSYNLSRQ